MRAVVVVVDVPHGDRGIAGILAIELASVEQFLDQDSLVALNLAVVARGVRLPLLMSRASSDDPGEVTRAVAGPVVGDDPVDVRDAVRCEPDLGSGQERSSGGSLLVRQRLGVGEPGESVDGRMQVGMATLRAS